MTQTQCGISFQDGVGGNSPVNRSRFANTAFDRLRILEKYRRIGMVGLSSNPFRPSHFAAIYLLSEGYDVVPVNPREVNSTSSGNPTYPRPITPMCAFLFVIKEIRSFFISGWRTPIGR